MSETRQQRRLAAILAADVVGYTRAMALDEAGTLAQLQALLREVVGPAVAGQDGRIFKEMGDVIVEGDDLFGDGIIIAARLEAEAEPGGIVVSNAFRRHAEGRAGLTFDDLGTRQLKNVAEPMRVHLLRRDGGPPAHPVRSPLQRLALAGAAAVVLGLAVLWAASEFLGGNGPGDSAQATGTPAIAVLPFENLSQDQEQAYFADGLAEDLIADLSKIQGIQVISRTSSFADWVKAVPVEEIAKRLKVRYVVEGSVRRAGDQLRITASLIDTLSDTPIWTERFDGSGDDVFAFQDQITGEIVEALRVQLTPAEQKAVETRGTDDAAAYDAYLLGLRQLSARRRLDTEANAAAQAAFEEAILLDPDYALAYAGLGWAKWLYIEAINALESPDRAFALAEKSLALDDNALAHRTLARRHFSLLNYGAFATKKTDLAVAQLEAAKKLQPSDPDVLADLAMVLSFAGRPKEALVLIKTAMERNPNHPAWYYAASGIAYLLTEEPELAIRDLERWSESTPCWNVLQLFLVSAYGLAGQTDAAVAAFEKNTSMFRGEMSLYAVKRKWPMEPAEEEIFIRGLRVAGAIDTPG